MLCSTVTLKGTRSILFLQDSYFPGQRINLFVTGLDELGSPTSVSARLSDTSEVEVAVTECVSRVCQCPGCVSLFACVLVVQSVSVQTVKCSVCC